MDRIKDRPYWGLGGGREGGGKEGKASFAYLVCLDASDIDDDSTRRVLIYKRVKLNGKD